MSNKMWGGRFSEVPSKFVEEFGAVIKVETRLCPYDIQGSLAHVTMLGETGIVKPEDVEAIKKDSEALTKPLYELSTKMYEQAQAAGVEIAALSCTVTPNSITIDKPVPVVL